MSKLGEIVVMEDGRHISFKEYFNAKGYSDNDKIYIRVLFEDMKVIESYNQRFMQEYGRKPNGFNERCNPLNAKANYSCLVKDFDKLCQSRLYVLNANGYGIFLVVNGGGHNKQLVKDNSIPKSNFFEIDDIPLPDQIDSIDQFPLYASEVILTKKSAHTYFYYNGDDVSWKSWKDIQKRLINLFDSDPHICDESRVMRLPAFYHNKDSETRVLCQLYRFNPSARYTQQELIDVLPAVEKANDISANEGHEPLLDFNYENADVSEIEKNLLKFAEKHKIAIGGRTEFTDDEENPCVSYVLLDGCPFSHEHTTPDSYGNARITIGKYGFGFVCCHSHCSSRHWADFRKIYDEGSYNDGWMSKTKWKTRQRMKKLPASIVGAI